MRQPAPAARQDLLLDRLDDLAAATAALRKAVGRGDRVAIETACWSLTRRLAAAPLEGDDEDEIRATVGLIEARVRFGLHERLRKFLLPLVAAVELQIEAAEKDL